MALRFEGTQEQYDQIRTCLARLREKGVGISTIKARSGFSGNRTTLSRFIKHEIERINLDEAKHIWEYLQEDEPVIFNSPHDNLDDISNDESLFFMMIDYFDLKSARIVDFGTQFEGNFQVFARSEAFFNHQFVTRSTIEFLFQNNTLMSKEIQKYDGSLGLHSLHEEYKGLCIPKSGMNIIIQTEKYRKKPRIMFIRNSRENTRNGKQVIEFFDGFVISYSRIYQPYFQTNFYAKRILDGDEIEPNVIRRADVGDPIIDGHLFDFKVDVAG